MYYKITIVTTRISDLQQCCHYLSNALVQHFSNFFEVGTTFLSRNSSADHLTLVPFESKFIIFVAYFNTSILVFCPPLWNRR